MDSTVNIFSLKVLLFLLFFAQRCDSQQTEIDPESCPVCIDAKFDDDESGELREDFLEKERSPRCDDIDRTFSNCTKYSNREVSCVFFWFKGNLSYYKPASRGELWGTACLELDQSRRYIYKADWKCSFLASTDEKNGLKEVTGAQTREELDDPHSCRIGRTSSVWNWKDPESPGNSSDSAGNSSDNCTKSENITLYVLAASLGLLVLVTAALGFLLFAAKVKDKECTVRIEREQRGISLTVFCLKNREP